MKTLSADETTAITSGVLGVVMLIKMELTSGTVALNTSNRTLTYDGVDYLGAYGLGTISQIDDSPGEVKGLQFELSGVAASSISLALDSTDEVQGAPVTIYSGTVSATTYGIVGAQQAWTGVLDTMAIQEDGETCTVVATAESSAVDLLRGSLRTYSDADQQDEYPGDLAFQYVVDQADKPVVFPAREYFLK